MFKRKKTSILEKVFNYEQFLTPVKSSAQKSVNVFQSIKSFSYEHLVIGHFQIKFNTFEVSQILVTADDIFEFVLINLKFTQFFFYLQFCSVLVKNFLYWS